MRRDAEYISRYVRWVRLGHQKTRPAKPETQEEIFQINFQIKVTCHIVPKIIQYIRQIIKATRYGEGIFWTKICRRKLVGKEMKSEEEER